MIEETSRFQLFYSNTRDVIVTVSDSMVGNMCGACDKFLPFRDTLGFSQAMMQEYMAAFAAQDFPTWWVWYKLVKAAFGYNVVADFLAFSIRWYIFHYQHIWVHDAGKRQVRSKKAFPNIIIVWDLVCSQIEDFIVCEKELQI